ncbi:MAG: type II restriction endonuclease [Clostridium butyricum]|nr:type II restriction endonuclease [Clostridium butyricum]MDU4853695.1 type II restriction endonuclease [Clostridioides difficile]
MKRNFLEWLDTFKDNISDYKYYINFEKVYRNVEVNRIELNILNSLLGSKNIKEDFELLIKKYPEVLKCIPMLIAVRSMQIPAMDEDGDFIYDFKNINQTIEQYSEFMDKTGLFDMLSNHEISSLVDFALGVETGLDSNGRKNRGGHLMEDYIEECLKNEKVEYYKEMYLKDVESKWSVDLSALSNNGKSQKRFDFIVKTTDMVYGIETNFYTSGGSKLNETARSYKMIAEESKNIQGFSFVWFTDGKGWYSARKNLEETFDVLEHLYNINDIENGIMKELFI